MKITVNELENCRYLVNYTADVDQVIEKRSEILDTFKKAPVKGFRRGKAPKHVIAHSYKTQINESLKRALAEEAFHETIFDKEWSPYGSPDFKSLLLQNNNFNCEFEVRIKPIFELASFDGMEIPNPHSELSAIDLTEKMMQELRLRMGESQPYNNSDVVEVGDNIIVDYDGFVDGEKQENLCATGEMLTVGKSQLVNFDENLIGMKLGETKEFEVVVPQNGLPSLVGKTILFKTTLNVGSKTTPHPLNDELAQKMKKENLFELRSHIRGIAENQLLFKKKQDILNQISERLIESNNFDIPDWMATSEAQYLAASSKVDFEKINSEDKEQIFSLAKKNVKLALILDKIRSEDPDAQLSDQEIVNMVKDYVSKSSHMYPNQTIDNILKEMNKTGQFLALAAKLKDEYTLDFIATKVKIIE